MSYEGKLVPQSVLLLSSAFALALDACSGGTGGAFVSAPRSLVPAVVAGSARVKAWVTIRIAIPKRKHHEFRIAGHYISAATKSIAIAVSDGTVSAKYNADLTPSTNPNCVSQPSG